MAQIMRARRKSCCFRRRIGVKNGMNFSKLLPVLCALAVGTNSLNVRAEDNPAQAAARIALAKALFELDAQKAQDTNAAAAAPQNPAPKVEPAPQTNDDNVVMTPINPPATDDAKAKARAEKAAAKAKAKQEADQAAADLKAKKEAEKKQAARQAAETKALQAQAEAKAKADQAAADAQAKQAAADLKAKKEADEKLIAQQAAEAKAAQAQAEAKAKADQAAADAQAKQAAADLKAKQAADKKAAAEAKSAQASAESKPATQPTAVAPQPAQTPDANYAGKDIGMKPIVAPALPITASKEEQLQALLVKYKADQISPEEYHKQRAAILAEP
jgi:colicin import membrane protein